MSDFATRTADKCGFIREVYAGSADPGDYVFIPFFGDETAEFVLAAVLLPRLHAGRRRVVCGWPGRAALFPGAEEYWGLRDEGAVRAMWWASRGFANADRRHLYYYRQLNRFGETVSPEELSAYYDDGLTPKALAGPLAIRLPAVPANRVPLPPGPKVVLSPGLSARGWNRGHAVTPAPFDFWCRLVEALLAAGLVPVVLQGPATHDLSPRFAGAAHFPAAPRALDIMSVMRACGQVLDVFGGLSRVAQAARVPCLRVFERQAWDRGREYELDEACGARCGYIFSYATMLNGGADLCDTIVARLKSTPHEGLPPAPEFTGELRYDRVREYRVKQLGTRFIRTRPTTNNGVTNGSELQN